MTAPSRQRALVAAAIAGAALLHGWRFRHHLTDDAFISFRYLANFFDGHGLVYNPGERVWGFTNFLWMAAIAPGFAAGLDPLACARALGCLATLATLLLVLASGPRRWNPAGALLLASTGPFLMQAWSGLETSLFSLLVLASLALERRARERGGAAASLAGLAAALATLTRPEGIFLFGLLLLAALAGRRGPGPAPGRPLGGLLLGFAPPALLAGAGLWSYYGAPWPNSIDAKVGLSAEQLRRGLHYAGVFIRNYPVYALLPLAAAWRWRAAAPAERLLLLAALLFWAFPVAVGGDWMLGYRLFHPAMVLGASLVPMLRLRRALAAALLALFVPLGLFASFRDPHVEVASRPTLVYAGIRIGRFMRENLPPDALLATSTAGTIPYYSGLPVIDMMGLNDRTIAGRRELPPAWKGIEKGDGRYVLSREPDFVQLGSYLGAAVPLFLSDIELYANEEFHRRYELVSFAVDPETTLRLWRRRERPRGPLAPEELARVRRVAERQLAISAFRY